MKSNYIGLVLFEIATLTVKMYEENFVEIQASSLEEAQGLIDAYAEDGNHEYKNEDNELVKHTFMQVIDVSEVLYEEADNSVRELYSRHFDNLEAYNKMEKLTK